MRARCQVVPRGGADDLRRIIAMIEKAVETNQVWGHMAGLGACGSLKLV